MKPRKVFSQKLAKSYWITLDFHAPISGLPCFTQRECAKIKELTEAGEMDTKALEWLYTQKLEDWRYDPFPGFQERVVTEITTVESIPEVAKAREECLAFVKATLRPTPKETDAKDAPGYSEGDAKVSNPERSSRIPRP